MYSLVCGNSSLPAHLLDVSEASIQRGTKIEAVEKTASGTYFLHTEKDSKAFDGVFVTAPLEVAGIKFEGVSPPSFAEQTYQMVYRRVVRGVFEPCFLRLEKEADVPSVVLTTKAADPLTQLSIQRIENGEVLVTASSPQPIKDTVFEGMFKARWVTVLEHQWKTAYPQFKPVNKLPPTRIDDGLLYVSAVEHAVATMETSAFSALNAVKLFRQRVI
jgi:prenylcysteine oxidase/farnesylcysteine lyase